jgi:GNAT superfamily N-acetyltransferase
MSWSAVRVRAATAKDVPAMVDLAEELRELLGPTVDRKRVRAASAANRAVLASWYTSILADPDRQFVVAVAEEDTLVGMALFTVAPANALLDTPALHVSHAVADRHKRRGAGKALVGAAASFAEERGLDQIVVSVHPGSRDGNRFFARLGFAPLAVRRVAPTAVVRRRLQSSDAPPTERALRARPHRLRRLPTTSAPMPLGPVNPDL